LNLKREIKGQQKLKRRVNEHTTKSI